MTTNEKVTCERREPLQLIGSQMNLSLRSNQIYGPVCDRKRRPQSAHLPHRSHFEHNTKFTRPKSAENSRLKNSNSVSHFHWLSSLNEHKLDEVSLISTSQYTDSSSRLLQNLLGNCNYSVASDVSNDKSLNRESTYSGHEFDAEDIPVQKLIITETNHQKPEYQEVVDKSSEIDLSNFFEDMKDDNEVKEENLRSLSTQPWLPEMVEEKTVRFLERQHCPRHHWRQHERRAFVDHYCHRIDRESFYFNWKNEFEDRQLLSPSPEIPCQRFSNPEIRHDIQGGKELVHERAHKEDLGEVGDMIDKPEVVKESKKDGVEASYQKCFNTANKVENSKVRSEPAKVSDSIYHTSRQFDEPASKLPICSDHLQKSEKVTEYCMKMEEVPKKSDQTVEEAVKDDYSCTQVNVGDSTYEEIVRLIQTLDEEDLESLDEDSKKDFARVRSPLMESCDEKIDRFDEVYSYLEKVEKDSELMEQTTDKELTTCVKTFSSPRLEELLNKNSVELAHEVLSLKIQIEDQKQGIKLLRDTLAEMKESSKSVELAHQEALRKANAEAEALIQRHQKFIKQLLNEKKNLNETVSKLVEDLKSGEERHKKNLKAVEERHLVEIKRVKDAQTVAEKLKREKWMETKTQKIKEMTVKGLEPELSRMAAHQQQEMVELRNLHRAELEAVELRAARRTSELMDQQRIELTKEKENAINRETTELRAKMEKQFEDERNKLQNYCQKLKDQIRREEEKLGNQELEYQQRLLECRKGAEKERQKMSEDFQEKLEETRRRHLIELKNQRVSMEGEKEIWMNNYKKQQSALFLEKEAELRQQYKRERDKDIEVIIETLENESVQARLELNEAAENKLRRLREKLENEIKELETSEALLKTKLSEAKSQLSKKEDVIVELNSQIRQFQTEITFLRKSCEQMTTERANLREIMKREFEGSLKEIAKEKENIEREITTLKETHLKELVKKDQVNVQAKNEMQRELTRVYSRIKTAVNKKEKIIKSLREENRAAEQRCQQLELMLDRQRRNLLLQ